MNSDRSAICETAFYSTCMDIVMLLECYWNGLEWNGLIDWITIACYISSCCVVYDWWCYTCTQE